MGASDSVSETGDQGSRGCTASEEPGSALPDPSGTVQPLEPTRFAGDRNVSLSAIAALSRRGGAVPPRSEHLVFWFAAGTVTLRPPDRVAGPDAASILSASASYGYDADAERITLLRISEEFLRHEAAELGTPLPAGVVFGQQDEHTSGSAPLRTLIGETGRAIADPSTPVRVRAVINRRVAETVLDTFSVESFPADQSQQGWIDPIDQAIAFVHTHARQGIGLADIAAAVGRTPRSVQQGFIARVGTTPMRYILHHRLEQVRAELVRSRGAATEREVAYGWGFRHFGRFSAAYANRFGEMPADTLRAARTAD